MEDVSICVLKTVRKINIETVGKRCATKVKKEELKPSNYC